MSENADKNGANIMDFVHLHVHSDYSLLDGMCHIKQLVEKAKEYGMSACALTDHGYMFGAIDFYKACKEAGIKPIIGTELYTAANSIWARGPEDRKSGHLVLLAKDATGYKNLVKLASAAAVEGFYYYPRCDFSLLNRYHEGLIALSACLKGDVTAALVEGDTDKAREIASKMKSIFGDDYYIELQYHGLKDQRDVLPKLIALAKELDIQTVATNDVHYIEKEDAFAQHTLSCIKQKRTVDDPEAYGFGNPDQWYFKSADEMALIFGKIAPEALENTVKIADKCNVEIEFGAYHLPKFPTPPTMPDNTTYLRALAHAGLKKRYHADAESHEAQLDYELGIIEKMGFVDYFLIVSDFINYAKRNRIPVGPGRGSAAASMVAYCTGITDLEPTKYHLVFERFLNPERVNMPDIDVDFDVPDGRAAVMAYVAEKYGPDHVAQIVTFGTLAARGVIRDVGKALNMQPSDVSKISKFIPVGPGITLKDTLKNNISFQKAYKHDADVRKLVDTALKLEGSKRHSSTHAAGLIISPQPVTDFIPVSRGETIAVSQYYMGAVEETGMLKVDFLGLKNLTVLQNAEDAVNDRGDNQHLDLRNIDMEDPNVYKMLAKGDTAGVFQLESGGMRDVLKKLNPTCLEDIIAVIALYRPGPMDSIPAFIRGKKDPSSVTYKHPMLEPILKDTYGQIVYQEQVMEIVRDLAGYSYGRSDLVRRAMAKKKADKMAKEHDIFINGHLNADGSVDVPGCIKHGISEEIANSLWEEMASFANYAFNRAHAAAYAVVAYRTAYMRCYFPLEFQAALMTNALDAPDKLLGFIDDCDNRGIKVLPPDINHSSPIFTVENGSIRFGLLAIKHTGKAILAELVAERRANGPYTDLQNIMERCPTAANKATLEALIKAGACDSFKENRAQMLDILTPMLKKATKARKKAMEGQISMEDGFFTGRDTCEVDFHFEKVEYKPLPELTSKEKLNMEKESTGMYITGHPMADYREVIRGRITHRLSQLALPDEEDVEALPEVPDDTQVRVAGVILQVKGLTTKKKQQPMCAMTIEDLSGKMGVTVFPEAYEAYSSILKEGAVILLTGNVDTSSFGRKIIVDTVELLSGATDDKKAEGGEKA